MNFKLGIVFFSAKWAKTKYALSKSFIYCMPPGINSL
jgi:hypothetical protein